jgi:hypothetical protein
MDIFNTQHLILSTEEDVENILNTGLFNNSDIKKLPNNTKYVFIDHLSDNELNIVYNAFYNNGLV